MTVTFIAALAVMTFQAECQELTEVHNFNNGLQQAPLLRIKRDNSDTVTPLSLSPLKNSEWPMCEVLDSTSLNLGANTVQQTNVDFNILLQVLSNALKTTAEMGIQPVDADYVRAFGEGAHSSCWLHGATVPINALSRDHTEVVLETREDFYLLNMVLIQHGAALKSIVLSSGVFSTTATRAALTQFLKKDLKRPVDLGFLDDLADGVHFLYLNNKILTTEPPVMGALCKRAFFIKQIQTENIFNK